MSWSPQQDAALRAVARWLREPEEFFYLAGYAGTGKTTLARHIAGGVDGEVLFAAYTGKAAHVMRGKDCVGASTIHNLIYRLVDEESEKDDRKPRPRFVLDRDSRLRRASLLIIDECSMVDEVIGRDLLSFGVPLLVLGDPAQLPPIEGGGHFTGTEPDVMLTEIHRQARDNPIVRMSMIVREGGRLKVGSYGDSRVTTGNTDADELAADQVLIGRNCTRRANNADQRRVRGMRGAHPVVGDKLVCLRNNHGKGLLNGSMWFVRQLVSASADGIMLHIEPDIGGDTIRVLTHPKFFDGRDDELSPWERWEYDQFDFGYALTVHKAQGSQWDNVVLIDESRFFRQHHRRWLYTGITRAAKQITMWTREHK
jgi:exodeoxyribonuclease-5